MQSRHHTPKFLPKRNENICLHKTCTWVYKKVLFILDKTQDTFQMSIVLWLDKQAVISIWGIQFCNKEA